MSRLFLRLWLPLLYKHHGEIAIGIVGRIRCALGNPAFKWSWDHRRELRLGINLMRSRNGGNSLSKVDGGLRISGDSGLLPGW